MKKWISTLIVLCAILCVCAAVWHGAADKQQGATDTPIVCRVSGCGQTPVYTDWDDRYCKDHLDRSKNHASSYDGTAVQKKVNTQRALTREEANALRGTGYHGTRPNSSAESMELAAAMVTCKNCGMHSDNGLNSLCDACQYNQEHDLD